jgi:fatty acid desaturase
MEKRVTDDTLLLRTPRIAWPTLGLFGLACAILGTSLYLGLTEQVATSVVVTLNTIALYMLFTVLHDASHRALSTIVWLNEAVGNMAAFLLFPMLTVKNFRYVHLQHHRYTNAGDKLDPDDWARGPWWILPVKCLTVHFWYICFYLRVFKERPRQEILGGAISSLLGLGVLLVAYHYGYVGKWLWYFLVATTLSYGFLGFTFDYLPHHPHDTTGADNPYRATSVRLGAEWLLTPLFIYHNYHLIHHLWPRVPFYRYGAVWRAKREMLASHQARVVSLFGKECAVR